MYEAPPPTVVRAQVARFPEPLNGDRMPMDSAEPGGFDPTDIVHGIRRRGMLCLFIGIPLALLAAAGIWKNTKPTYSADAWLRMSATGNSLIFDDVEKSANYELFKGTQKQLITSRRVVALALQNPILKNSSIIKEEAYPIDWVAENLRVDTSNTELVRLSVETLNPQDAVNIVNAVLDAYHEEIVMDEVKNRHDRLKEIDEIYSEKEIELRQKLGELKDLAEASGSGDSKTLTLQQQMTLTHFAALREKYLEIEFNLMQRRIQDAVVAEEPATEEEPLSEGDEKAIVDYYVRQSQDVVVQQQRVASAEKLLADTKTKVNLEKHIVRVEKRVAEAKEELTRIESEVRETVVKQIELERQAKIASLKTGPDQSIALLEAQKKALEADLEKSANEAKNIGRSSVDVEMKRSEIDQLSDVLQTISQQRQQLRVELKSQLRVNVEQRADQARPANFMKRVSFAGLAGMGGFILPAALILLRELLGQKVGSAQRMSRIAGLDLVGTVPVIPRKAIGSRNGKTNKKTQYWQGLLSESIKRIISRLLSTPKGQATKLLLVTSASSGEGKTSLATQMALNLAKTGRSVVLADLDLRYPAIHRAYSVAKAPGFCEVLRGEIELVKAVQPTGVEHLSILSAGECDALSLRMLGHESTASLFKEMRSLADYIIIDASPILPSADIGYICPHVDGVLLSVRRDISRLPDVCAAKDFLTKSNTPIVGAVVLEPSEIHRRDRRYLNR